MEYRLPLEIEVLEEGGFLASCPAIQGCYAEGQTIGEALDNLQSVAQVIYELCQEKNLPFVMDAPEVPADRIVWYVEFTPSLEFVE